MHYQARNRKFQIRKVAKIEGFLIGGGDYNSWCKMRSILDDLVR